MRRRRIGWKQAVAFLVLAVVAVVGVWRAGQTQHCSPGYREGTATITPTMGACADTGRDTRCVPINRNIPLTQQAFTLPSCVEVGAGQ